MIAACRHAATCRRAAAGIVAVAAVSLSTVAAAQTIDGEVVDGSTGAPVAGAYIFLEREPGVRTAGVLAGQDGRFRLNAASDGAFTLVVEQIGYGRYEESDVVIDSGTMLQRRIVLLPRAVLLDAVHVEAARRCVLARDLALETMALWHNVQQAFQRAAWDPARRARTVRSVIYSRELDPRTLRVRRERADSASSAGAAFVTADAADLMEHGYIQPSGAGYEFFAPGPHTFVSAAFADRYCVSLRRDAGTDIVGLDFEPVDSRRAADIRGTLWLDPVTFHLQAVDFQYTGLPWDVDMSGTGGRLEFAALPDGAWIVQRWHIRMPQVQRVPGTREGRGMRLTGISETAGEVLRVAERGGRVIASFAPGSGPERAVMDSTRAGALAARTAVTAPTGAEPAARTGAAPAVAAGAAFDDAARAGVRGIVLDRDTGEPVSAAAVRVGTATRPVMTDATGRFIMQAAPGRHPFRVEALGYEPVEQDVLIVPGEALRVEVSIARNVVALDAIEVVARGVALPGPLAAFAERRELATRLGLGLFLDRADLERRGSSIIDIVRTVPFVQLVDDPGNAGGRRILFGRGLSRCEPNIYVDGMLARRSGDGVIDHMVPTGPYEAVEIYRTPAELPVEFSGSDGRCGAIIIWMPRF